MTFPARNRPLHVGLILTTVEDRANDTILQWPQIAQLTRLAEEARFDSVWIPDHLIHEPEGAPRYGIWECWSIVAALAAVTTRIEIGTWVLCTSFRNPALIAKMADTVDEISSGRLILGLGAGWHEPEYRAFGFPFDHRIGRFTEAMQVIHGLLHDGRFDFEGRFSSASDCELRPRGPRPNGPPLMIGTIAGTPLGDRMGIAPTGTKVLDLVARYADLWNCPWINDPDTIPPIRAMVDQACEASGRDPATLGRSNGLMIDIPGWQGHLGNAIVREGRAALGAVEGEPAAIAELLWRFAENGVDQVHIQLDPETPEGISWFAQVLEQIDS
jgi:alkanesulfonate monooxygenase SsuD/methylene tetrahydromethanopterin reductase-like flavin-dependent oxidoreductase (luciferase family)